MPSDVPAHEHELILRGLQKLTRLMDTAFQVPGTKIRFGLDGLLGLIPGGGDAVGLLISTYMLVQAQRLGLPKHVLARMIANVGVDALVGAIPLLGDIFDVAFKANVRNLRLLERHASRLGDRTKTRATPHPPKDRV